MYTHLPAALLPKRFRGSRGGGGGGGAPYTPRGNTSSSNVMGMAAIRLANLVRKMLGGVTEGRAAGAAIHSKLERKVIHLDAPTSWQTEAQTAGARACPGRAAGNAVRRGLSGKRCKKVVSTVRNWRKLRKIAHLHTYHNVHMIRHMEKKACIPLYNTYTKHYTG